MQDSIKQRQFEKYTTQTTSRNFNLVFAQCSFVKKQNQADIIVYKNGGMITDASLSIPSYQVCVNKHHFNKFDKSKVLIKKFNSFDEAINLYNYLVSKYQASGYDQSMHINVSDVKKFWKGYFEYSVTYRTAAMSDKLIDDIVYAINSVVDRIAVNFIQQYQPILEDIVNQLIIAKVGMRKITDRVSFCSGYKIYNNCYNRWLKINAELQKTNPIFGNVHIAICSDKSALEKVTKSFRLYSNYSDRYVD